jgi:hypothetical protein
VLEFQACTTTPGIGFEESYVPHILQSQTATYNLAQTAAEHLLVETQPASLTVGTDSILTEVQSHRVHLFPWTAIGGGVRSAAQGRSAEFRSKLCLSPLDPGEVT